jgi:hypothetical protein
MRSLIVLCYLSGGGEGPRRRARPSHFKTRGRLTDRLEVESRLGNDDSCGFQGERRKILLRGLRGASLWRAFPRLRGFFKAALWMMAIAALALGAFFIALARGPITLDWLTPMIVDSLDELYRHRYRFQLGGAAIANTSHGPTLSVERLIVRSDDRTILAAPRAELSVDLRSLLVGRIKPRRLEVLDLELGLSVTPDGAVAISAGTDPADAIPIETPKVRGDDASQAPTEIVGAPPPRVALLRQAAAALRGLFDLATSPDSAIGDVDRIGVSHGRLVIDDKTLGRVIRYDDLSLRFEKAKGAMSFSLAATGASRRWTAVATARGAPGEQRTFDARLRDFSLDEIALVMGSRNLKFDTDSPMSLNMHFALESDDRVLEAKGSFGAGSGYFRLEDPDHEPMLIDHFSAEAHWDRHSRQFVVEPVTFKARGTELTFKGSATPQIAGTGDRTDSWAISAALAKPGRFGAERAGDKSLIVDRAVFAAHFKPRDKTLSVDKFEAGGPDLNAAASGSVAWAEGLRVAYAISLADTPLLTVLRLWPTHVAAGVRAWLLERVTSGVVRTANMNADFDLAAMTAMRYERPPPDGALRVDFDIVNGTIGDLLPGMPPVANVSGRGHVTGRTANFAVSSATLETAPQRRLTLAEGSFHVADNGLHPVPAVVDLRLGGNVEAVADLLALKSVAPYANLPIDGGALKGQIDGKLRVDFEIGPTARQEATNISIDANTTNFAIERLIGKERLENASLNVVSDRAGLHVSGAGRLFGAPATLDVRRGHGDRGPAQAQLNLLTDDASRAKAGFGFAGLSGPMSVLIKTPLPMEDSDAQIELDLTRASLDNLLPGLVKPAGRPGKASFTLAKRQDGYALDQFLFDAGGAQIAGLIELTREGAFRGAKLSQVRLSPGDDARAEVVRAGEVMKLVVRGGNIDSRPVMRALLQGAPERPSASGSKSAVSFDDFDLDLKSPIVSGYGKQILANFDLRMERRGGRPRALTLNANLGREPLAVTMQRGQNGVPQIEISAGDGGSLLSFFDLYHKMDSGALTATVQIGQGRADGALRIQDFYLRNEPAMRQLMTQGVARPDDKGVLRFDPDSVRFSRLQSAFTWSNGRLSLRDGVMSGPDIGLTADGYIDFSRDRIDVSGAYVPAYGLNNLLSNIPVLGVVLAGGQHEGVFALNFRVTGAFSAPTLNVNPLSVIAPGLIRKVMGIMDGTSQIPDAGGAR